jgi:hypothetical protein
MRLTTIVGFTPIGSENLCCNCIYNRPNKWDYTMERSLCDKFPGKYSDLCRKDEQKCGQEGKYFIDKKNK